MTVFRNYNFEYNAQRVDIFTATAVCSNASDVDLFKEGCSIEITDAAFYGEIVSSQNTGAKYTLDIKAESWARELRNTAVEEYSEFRLVDAILLIKEHLLPDGWELEYPALLDTNPRYISYILRNGTFASHIGTIMDVLGLDYTIYSEYVNDVLVKKIKAYFRDDYTDRPINVLEEYKDFGNMSITAEYGKIATSITCLGAESEQGTNQVYMDAEMGDWTKTPHIIEIKDTVMKRPEMSAETSYFWYYPASPELYTVDLLAAGDIVTIDDERMQIEGVYFLSEIWVASLEDELITDDDIPAKLENISEYESSGVIVASVEKEATVWMESVQDDITLSNNRCLSNYADESAIHAIYDDILLSSVKVSSSDYITYEKNLPATNGFIWLGSERAFYRAASDDGDYYTLTGMVRGLPSCATASCQHCGSRDGIEHIGYSYGCPYGGSDTDFSGWCTLLSDIKTAFGISANIHDCPLCFDNTSPCPAMKCPLVKNDSEFQVVCPKGISKTDISWTQKYQHHKDTIVFPASYYYPTNAEGETEDTYEIYARDSLIAKYGYLPTQISAKGIADLDSLDKLAEGRLRLSAIPITGKLTLFDFDPWTIPASCYPGDVIQIKVASHARYNFADGFWYPTQWFDVSSTDPEDETNWQQVASNPASWVKTQQKFVIQKTIKNQRGMPEISFGTSDTSIQSIMDYIAETADTTSQRHRNQDSSKIVKTSETGMAAKVQNLKTSEQIWVRMVR